MTQLAVGDPRHGTLNAYKKLGCRCETCRRANTQSVIAWRRRNRDKPTPSHRHGTVGGYMDYGCRCEECRRAWAAYVRTRPSTIAYRRRQGHKPLAEHLAAIEAPHGTEARYKRCKCDDCRRAGTEARRRRRAAS